MRRAIPYAALLAFLLPALYIAYRIAGVLSTMTPLIAGGVRETARLGSDSFHLDFTVSAGTVALVLGCGALTGGIAFLLVRSQVRTRSQRDWARVGLQVQQVRGEQLERLVSAVIRLTPAQPTEQLLQVIADSARAVIDCKYAALGVVAPEGDRLERFVHSGLSQEQAERIGSLPRGQGLLGVLIAEPHAVRIPDIASHPKSSGFPAFHPHMGSFLGVPVTGRRGVLGNLYCTEKRDGGGFTAQDEAVATMFASVAAITVENNRSLDRLQELQGSRDRFYAMMNHELRNALTGVYGWVEILQREAGARASRPVVEAIEAADYAVMLLNDMLDLSRLEDGRFEITPQRSEAEVIVSEAVRIVEPLALKSDVRITAFYGKDRTPCVTDPRRVRQILVNLLRNAIQHSSRSQSVDVALQTDEARLSLSITDRGPGIDEEQQQRLFEAYRRADTGSAGTGLGLTLSRRLARLLGGDVKVRSRLRQGSTFTVEIARFMNLREPETPVAEGLKPPAASRLSIMHRNQPVSESRH